MHEGLEEGKLLRDKMAKESFTKRWLTKNHVGFGGEGEHTKQGQA